MPSNKTGRVRVYSIEDLIQTYDDFKSWIKLVRKAAEDYKVPYGTLQRACSSNDLTFNILDIVQKMINDDGWETPFVNGRPGLRRIKSFFNQHPHISHRTPETVTKNCKNFTEKAVREWFDEVKKYVKEKKIEHVLNDPRRLFNCDESGFKFCPKKQTMIAMNRMSSYVRMALPNFCLLYTSPSPRD